MSPAWEAHSCPVALAGLGSLLALKRNPKLRSGAEEGRQGNRIFWVPWGPERECGQPQGLTRMAKGPVSITSGDSKYPQISPTPHSPLSRLSTHTAQAGEFTHSPEAQIYAESRGGGPSKPKPWSQPARSFPFSPEYTVHALQPRPDNTHIHTGTQVCTCTHPATYMQGPHVCSHLPPQTHRTPACSGRGGFSPHRAGGAGPTESLLLQRPLGASLPDTFS